MNCSSPAFTADGHVLVAGDAIVTFPWPIRDVADDGAGGALVVLSPLPGIAAGVTLVRVDSAGRRVWDAEPFLLPPEDDPYVAVEVVGAASSSIIARSASGVAVSVDLATGTVSDEVAAR